ncbi:MAG: hypothetical protein V3T17_10030 [Pseudomonadales bacterium]
MTWIQSPQLVNLNFDGDSAGSIPGYETATPGEVLLKPTAISGETNSILVEDGYPSTIPLLGGSGDNVVVFTDEATDNDNALLSTLLSVDDRVARGRYYVRWKMLIDSAVTRTGRLTLQLRNSDGYQLARIYFEEDGAVSISHKDGINEVLESLTLDEVHEFEWELDFNLKKQSLEIDGVAVGDNYALRVPLNSLQDLASFYWFSVQASTGKMAIDDFNVSANQSLHQKAINIPVTFKDRTLEFYEDFIDEIADIGYDILILNLNGQGASSLTADGLDSSGKATFTINKTDSLVGMSGEEAISHLIDKARENGIEPVLNLRVAGKQGVLAGIFDDPVNYQGFMMPAARNKNRAEVISPDYSLGSHDIFDGFFYPALDKILSLYEDSESSDPPKYFMLGVDEVDVETLEDFATNSSYDNAGEVYATLINGVTDYLVDESAGRNITPIMWGDMLLSYRLGESEISHEVSGWYYDSRFLHRAPSTYVEGGYTYKAAKYNAEDNHVEPDGSTGSTLLAINYLRNKEKTIVVPWDYFSYGHVDSFDNPIYPAVDYFQRMGFLDVWGATWYEEKAQQKYSQYIDDHLGGGMMATLWSLAINKESSSVNQQFFSPLIYNSSVYFNYPDFIPPENSELDFNWVINSVSQSSTGVYSNSSDTSIEIVVTAPPMLDITLVNETSLFLFDHYSDSSMGGRRDSERVDIPVLGVSTDVTTLSHPSTGQSVPLDALLTYQYGDSGYLVSTWLPGSFVLASDDKNSVVEDVSGDTTGTLYGVDFTKFETTQSENSNNSKNLIYRPNGVYGDDSLIIARPNSDNFTINSGYMGYMDLRWAGADTSGNDSGVYAYPAAGFVENIIAYGMTLTIEFKVETEPTADHAPIFSYGNIMEGFRILYKQATDSVTVQFARGGASTSKGTNVDINLNEKVKLEVTYDPAITTYGQVTIISYDQNGGQKDTASYDLDSPFVPPTGPFGFASEFKGGFGEPTNLTTQTWNPWPANGGKLYKVTITQ